MKYSPKNLRILPRLHESERVMLPNAITNKSTLTDKNIVRLTNFITSDEDALDATDARSAVQTKRRNTLNYKAMRSVRTTSKDAGDPFAEPLD
jgi:hypothetical protein